MLFRSLVTNEYTTYRGGKQSNRRQNTNIEFILSIDTSRKSDADSIREIDFILKRKKTLLLFKQRYSYERLEKIADRILEDEKILLGKIEIQTKDFFTLEIPENFDSLNFCQLEELSDKLTNACCQTKEEELEEILLRLKWEKSDKRLLVKLIPQILNKLANKKNERSFMTWLLKIQNMQKTNESLYELISDKIERIKAVAERRFSVVK